MTRANAHLARGTYQDYPLATTRTPSEFYVRRVEGHTSPGFLQLLLFKTKSDVKWWKEGKRVACTVNTFELPPGGGKKFLGPKYPPGGTQREGGDILFL